MRRINDFLDYWLHLKFNIYRFRVHVIFHTGFSFFLFVLLSKPLFHYIVNDT